MTTSGVSQCTATLSPPILLSMVYYIDRLSALFPVITLSSLTVHRYLITSAVVSSKGLSDTFWTNRIYARVGGITVAELAVLELEFLQRMHWMIIPQPDLLVDNYYGLIGRSAGYQMERKGTFHTHQLLLVVFIVAYTSPCRLIPIS
jgi:hypothetical protein